MSFWQWLFSQKKIDRNNITPEFQEFRQQARVDAMIAKVAKKSYTMESDKELLYRYIWETAKSPFVGDDNLREARKFIRDHDAGKS